MRIMTLRTPKILSERELERFLRVSRATIRAWFLYPRQPHLPNFPEHRKGGRRWIWSLGEVASFFKMRIKDSRQIKTLYSVKELAIELSVSESTIRRLIYNGKLEYFRLGTKLIRVTADSLEKYIDDQQKEKIRKLREGMMSRRE